MARRGSLRHTRGEAPAKSSPSIPYEITHGKNSGEAHGLGGGREQAEVNGDLLFWPESKESRPRSRAAPASKSNGVAVGKQGEGEGFQRGEGGL